MMNPGVVYLVGAGPGDPDLLTVKALRLVRSADVVVFDRLVAPEILALIPPGIARIAVGKAPGHHCMPQGDINALLVNLASRGRRVVRLKGGDPFVFGRGSEEALVLRRHGIPFEVIPGITAAAAATAYAGIPLTHRGVSRGVRLVTGHLRDDETLDLDWQRLADPEATLVVYMGLASLSTIATRLIAAGRAPQTPAAAIQEGSTPRQRSVRATLATLPDAVSAAGLRAPVAIVVGETVTLADELAWFVTPAAEVDHDASRRARA
jgi:uroporphyrin-III C-methyltransferase/precorrin-2 dehydrogenase/sirohydrochlorin ferrochelatase/uroporphyrin-III C-methyltransferase